MFELGPGKLDGYSVRMYLVKHFRKVMTEACFLLSNDLSSRSDLLEPPSTRPTILVRNQFRDPCLAGTG